MKEDPDKNKVSGKDHAFFQPGFSTFLNDNDLVDGDVNGFDEEVNEEPDATDEENTEPTEENSDKKEEDKKAERLILMGSIYLVLFLSSVAMPAMNGIFSKNRKAADGWILQKTEFRKKE